MSNDHWLGTLWPLVRDRLPPPPARVIDIGCGPHGGFVPFLLRSGYEAVGVDPKAPDAAEYHRLQFEQLELQQPFDAAIASTSLHHVNDPAAVIGRVMSGLTSGGLFIVVEWAWERFDDATAAWCFERLATDDEETWLHRRRAAWAASGREWQAYFRGWADDEGLHRGDEVLRLLDERFERRLLTRGPYFFPDLADTSAADEQTAIDAGRIEATRIDWVGSVRAALSSPRTDPT